MEFHERLVELRKERGFTRDGFAEYLGISKYTLRNYELGKTEPGHVFLKYLANVFKVSVDYLLCTTDDRTPYNKTPAYTTQEIEHIKKYRSLDDHGKKIVDMVINEEFIRSTSPKEQNIFYNIPYSYDLPAYAGGGQYIMDIAHFKNVTLSEQPPKGTDFMIRVSGDSMEPKFSDGDKVFIKRNDAVEIGEIGLFYVDGGIYIKKQGYNELISLNPQYPPILVNEFSSTKCFGKVLGKCKCEIFDF